MRGGRRSPCPARGPRLPRPRTPARPCSLLRALARPPRSRPRSVLAWLLSPERRALRAKRGRFGAARLAVRATHRVRWRGRDERWVAGGGAEAAGPRRAG